MLDFRSFVSNITNKFNLSMSCLATDLLRIRYVQHPCQYNYSHLLSHNDAINFCSLFTPKTLIKINFCTYWK